MKHIQKSNTQIAPKIDLIYLFFVICSLIALIWKNALVSKHAEPISQTGKFSLSLNGNV